MELPFAKRLKCEFDIVCTVEPKICANLPEQWKITLDTGLVPEHEKQIVVFSDANREAACSAIARLLHVDCDSIDTQLDNVAASAANVTSTLMATASAFELPPTPTLLECMLHREVPLASTRAADAEQQSKMAPPGGKASTTETVVGYVFVSSLAKMLFQTLGPGFCESVYHKGLSLELSANHIAHEMERVIPVTYKGMQIGVVRADIIVQNNMVIELKTVVRITQTHLQQAERYAQLLNLSKMIVINFPGVAGARLEVYIFEGTWRNISGKQD